MARTQILDDGVAYDVRNGRPRPAIPPKYLDVMTDTAIDSLQTLPNRVMSWPAFDVDWSHSALLLIDWQNDAGAGHDFK